MSNTEIEILKLIFSVIVAFIAAYGGARFAFSKFKKEKIWDQKREAYETVVASVEKIKFWGEAMRAQCSCDPSDGVTNSVDVHGDYQNSLREIERYSSIGDLRFSAKFSELLREMNTKLNQAIYQHHNDSHSVNEREVNEELFHKAVELRDIANKYLPKLIRVANNDLPK